MSAPVPPRQVSLDAHVNWSTGTVQFTERELGGLAIINPPAVTVPLALIVRIACDTIFNGLPPNIQALNFAGTPTPEPPNERGGRSLAFDADVGRRKS